jgi:hypothetical protein
MAKSPTRNVKLAVVGIYFGTTASVIPGTPGVAGSKFRNAPSASVPARSSIKNLADEIAAQAANARIPNCTGFGVRVTATAPKRIMQIHADYSAGPKFGLASGRYSLADHTAMPNELINPKLAWQTYIFNAAFVPKPGYFFNGGSITDDTDFDDGDLVLFRCVLIATNQIDFVPAADISAKAVVAA